MTHLSNFELSIVAFAFLMCCFMVLGMRLIPKEKRQEISNPPVFVSNVLVQEYALLLDRIRGAATTTELACLQDQALDFKLDFEKRTNDAEEYFTDLMKEIHIRSIRLRWLEKKAVA